MKAFAGDVQDPDLAQRTVNRCKELWGPVDILLNNAGGPPMGSFLEHDGAAWQTAVQTNLFSVVRFKCYIRTSTRAFFTLAPLAFLCNKFV